MNEIKIIKNNIYLFLIIYLCFIMTEDRLKAKTEDRLKAKTEERLTSINEERKKE